MALIKTRFNNKRAMFFTMMAVVILFVFFLSYSVYSIVGDRKAIDRRIDSMNNYVFSLQKTCLDRDIYQAIGLLLL